MAIATPSYNLRQFVNVYEPAEDTFLLLDALELDSSYIKELKPCLIAEIGCGSGVIITALATLLKHTACFATDVNPEACLATNHTAFLNRADVEIISMSFLGAFRRCMFDLIVFNPPYVVTDSGEVQLGGLARAWAGGKGGREVIDEFLALLPAALSPKGACYLVVIEENEPAEIGRVLGRAGLACVVLKERKIRGERLYVLKVNRGGAI